MSKEVGALGGLRPRALPLLRYQAELAKEGVRGKVLVSSAFLEEELKQILLAFLIDDPRTKDLVNGVTAPFSSFSQRTHACFVLGLIAKKEYDDLDVIRGVRNEFAHTLGMSFANDKVRRLCEKLVVAKAIDRPLPKKKAANVSHEALFMISVVTLIDSLIGRREEVLARRCVVYRRAKKSAA